MTASSIQNCEVDSFPSMKSEKQNHNSSIVIKVEPCSNNPIDQDAIVSSHWHALWKEAGFSENEFSPHWQEITTKYLQNARQNRTMEYQTFVARHPITNQLLGSVSCQKWFGPVPLIVSPDAFCLGTLWGLYICPEKTATASSSQDYHRQDVATGLIQVAISYLREHGCQRILTTLLDSSPFVTIDRQVLTKLGFRSDNMLTLPFHEKYGCHQDLEIEGIEVLDTAGNYEDDGMDDIVCQHWKEMWLECGIPEESLLSCANGMTQSFLQDARKRLMGTTFVARSTERNEIVASLCCQEWEGPHPSIVPSRKLGTIWAVYVQPKYRRRGIATALMKRALLHLRDKVGCHSAILIAASKEGQCVYEKLGFRPNQALVCDLSSSLDVITRVEGGTEKVDRHAESKAEARRSDTVTETMIEDLKAELKVLNLKKGDVPNTEALLTATPQQLEAIPTLSQATKDAVQAVQKRHGTHIDPQDNWFTRNVERLGGGFDMSILKGNPEKLAQKFDKLASRYDHWTVGNCSQVEQFIASMAESRLLPSQTMVGDDIKNGRLKQRVLDVACGIGLQGQVLRLCGYRGRLVGTDISPEMVRRVLTRKCYDQAFVCNLNDLKALDALPTETAEEAADKGGKTADADCHLFDVVICTGAMELLDHSVALKNMSMALVDQGEIWLSFQHSETVEDDEKQNPTQHQNVHGVTKKYAEILLHEAGFDVVSIQECPNAFYTPSPKTGELLPVPYIFVVAQKAATRQ